jgi:hypothetical protein
MSLFLLTWHEFFKLQIVRSTLDPTGQVFGGFIDLEAVVILAIHNKEYSRYTGS